MPLAPVKPGEMPVSLRWLEHLPKCVLDENLFTDDVIACISRLPPAHPQMLAIHDFIDELARWESTRPEREREFAERFQATSDRIEQAHKLVEVLMKDQKSRGSIEKADRPLSKKTRERLAGAEFSRAHAIFSKDEADVLEHRRIIEEFRVYLKHMTSQQGLAT